MPKISIIIFIIQFYGSILGLSSLNDISNTFSTLFLITALLSMLLGTIVGLAQIKIKRLLAYSTISHIGFILLTLSIMIIVNNNENTFWLDNWNIIGCLVFYLIQYSFTNLIIFYVLIIRQSNTSKDITSYISDMKYWLFKEVQYKDNNKEMVRNNSNIFLSITFLICIFSLAGIPPLIGFYGKQMILSIALTNGLIIPSIIGILTSVISAAYYLKLISIMYFNDVSPSIQKVINQSVIYIEGEKGRTEGKGEVMEYNSNVNSITGFIISFVLLILIIGIMFLDPTLLLDIIMHH